MSAVHRMPRRPRRRSPERWFEVDHRTREAETVVVARGGVEPPGSLRSARCGMTGAENRAACTAGASSARPREDIGAQFPDYARSGLSHPSSNFCLFPKESDFRNVICERPNCKALLAKLYDPLETSRCLRIRQLWEMPVPASNSARGTPQGRGRRSTESTAPARADRAFRGIGLPRSWRMLGRVRPTPHRLFGAAA
jgi:hypothetical protein